MPQIKSRFQISFKHSPNVCFLIVSKAVINITYILYKLASRIESNCQKFLTAMYNLRVLNFFTTLSDNVSKILHSLEKVYASGKNQFLSVFSLVNLQKLIFFKQIFLKNKINKKRFYQYSNSQTKASYSPSYQRLYNNYINSRTLLAIILFARI